MFVLYINLFINVNLFVCGSFTFWIYVCVKMVYLLYKMIVCIIIYYVIKIYAYEKSEYDLN